MAGERNEEISNGLRHGIATDSPLSAEEAHRMDAWWRAANYLSVGQIYLLDNPLLNNRSSRSTSNRVCWDIGARRPV